MKMWSETTMSLVCLVIAIAMLSPAYAQLVDAEQSVGTVNSVHVELSEFKIHMPTQLPSGPTTFHVINTGNMEHDIVFTGSGVDVHFDQTLQPGEEGDLSVDLQPGQFRVWCPVGSHALRGMELVLTVGVTGDSRDTPLSDVSSSASPATIQPSNPASITTEPHKLRHKLIVWLGNFHPPMVNFPIALLAVGALAELLLMMTGNTDFAVAARYCIRLGAMAALGAGILGWFFGGFHVVDKNWIMTTHRWLGTSTVLIALLAWGLGEASWRRSEEKGMRTRYRMALFLASAMVLATGFLGGALVFGIHHYAWPK